MASGVLCAAWLPANTPWSRPLTIFLSLARLHHRFGTERELVVDFAEDYAEVDIAQASVSARVGYQVTYRFLRKAVSASDLIQTLAQRFKIADLTVREPEVESTIRRIYEERLLDKDDPPNT